MRSHLLTFTVLCFGALTTAYASHAHAQQSINLWFANDEIHDALFALSKQFSTQNSDIKINLVSLPNEDLKASIVRTLRNNLAPDIAILTSDNMAYAPIMQLSQFDISALQPHWDPSTQHSLLFNQKLYGLPLQRANRLLMFYNKSLVGKAETEWEEIINQADRFIDNDILPVGVLFKEPYWFGHFTTLFPVDLTHNELPNLDTLEMVEALKFFKRLEDASVIRQTCGYDCVSEDFYQGKVAYALNGVWAINDAYAALGENLGVASLPSFEGRRMKTLAATVMLTFPNDSWNGSNQKAIRTFAAFLRSKEAQIQMAKATNMLPINPTWLIEETLSPWHIRQLELTDEMQYMPASLSYVSIWNGMRKGMLLYQHGQLSADDAARYMQKVATEDTLKYIQLNERRQQ